MRRGTPQRWRTRPSPGLFASSWHASATHAWLVAPQYAEAQSAPAPQPFPTSHFAAHVPPQSTSVSPAESLLSWHAVATQAEPSQKVLVQSLGRAQPFPTAHFLEQLPPQSTSASPADRRRSSHAEATQLLPLQWVLAQSGSLAQLFWRLHFFLHGPPQSTSVSPASVTSSWQALAAHVCLLAAQ